MPVDRLAVAVLLGMLATSPTLAQDSRPGGVSHEDILNSSGFLAAHPDLRWRREGLWALEQGRGGEAFTFFQRAARYADKPSQAMLAEMLWTGRGVAVDRPLAYAWMDLAAERGYPSFLAPRERYWNELSDAERERAVQVGLPLMDEYGDAVAKPRLALLLKRERRNVTGSRTGFVGNLEIQVPGPGGMWQTISGDRFYDEELWEPEKYFAWQDRVWKDPPTGRVQILPMERVDNPDGEPEGGDR
jgi:uncharacterized protein